MRVPRGHRLKYFLTGIKDWFYPTTWDNGVCGPGYSSYQEFNWGKLSFVLLAIFLVIILIVVL